MKITEVQADARGKIYLRTEDGIDSYMTVKDALAEVNEAMIGRVVRERRVRTMSSGRGHHAVEYSDGRKVVLKEMDAPIAEAPTESDSKGRRIVTAKGKRYVVGSIIPEQTERKKFGKCSYSLPHPAYVHYWSVRNDEAFGPIRSCSGRNKPGTVGRAIWDAVNA